jgi:hypothetical protein
MERVSARLTVFPFAPSVGMPSPHADAVPQVSLVIPIRNEAGNIGPLIGEITTTLDAAGLSWELLVIDDGSTDDSPAEVAAAIALDGRIRCLPPSRGRGKSAALATGFSAARGVAVVMLDGDGQDDPAEIPGMLARLGVPAANQPATQAEAELVNGWKTPRLDPWHKTMPSRVFNLLVSWLTGLSLHDHNCGLKAMLRSTAVQLPLNTGMHRFIPVLAQAAGGRVVEQPVHHRRRTRGVSKYGVSRFFRGLYDLGRVWLLLQAGRLQTPATPPPTVDPNAGLRRWVYALLATIALGGLCGRILSVASVDRLAWENRLITEAVDRRLAELGDGLSVADIGQIRQEVTQTIQKEKRLLRPFLSANDRSRWLTIRSLVETGSFAIESVAAEPGWDSIDAVVHPDASGRLHLYSSKPPLLSVLLAGPYWLANRLTGWTLGSHPFELGRALLVCYSLVPFAIGLWACFGCIERIGRSDGGRLWAAAVVAAGTMLTTFAVALTNHLFAAACVAVSLRTLLAIVQEGKRTWATFAATGLAAGLAAAFDLPALAWVAGVLVILMICDARRTLLAAVPVMVLITVAALGTNVLAHGTPWPPYAFRSAPSADAPRSVSATQFAPEDEWNPNNWYDYRYTLPNGRVLESYWRQPQGIDRGESSLAIYALHVLIGHHGIFSLTPAWLLILPGLILLAQRPGPGWQMLTLTIAVVSVIVICFYLTRQPLDRNYGGMTSGFRWVFWLTPLWAAMLPPAADRLSASRRGSILLLVFLGLSVLSAAAPSWNPWTMPWLQRWLIHIGWLPPI